MSRVEQIEGQIKDLPPEELAAFRNWFTAFDAEVWDRQFEAAMTSRNGLSAIMRRAGRPSSDSPRLTGFLVRLLELSNRLSRLKRRLRAGLPALQGEALSTLPHAGHGALAFIGHMMAVGGAGSSGLPALRNGT